MLCDKGVPSSPTLLYFNQNVNNLKPNYVQIIVTDTRQNFKLFILTYDGKVCTEIGASVASGCQLCKGEIIFLYNVKGDCMPI